MVSFWFRKYRKIVILESSQKKGRQILTAPGFYPIGIYLSSFIAACAAATLAMGTL
jgi:hypothetical protein